MSRQKMLKIIWWLLILVPIALIILGYIYPSVFFGNQERIREYVLSYGALAPVAFILLQILQVVLTPISHYTVGLAGGFIFGLWYGFIYNLIGKVIGTLIAFYLGRKFGRKIIQRLVKPQNLKKYDKIFEKGKGILFLMYFLPLFPDDELSYLAGFSSMKLKTFIPLMVLGHVGGALGLAILGSGLSYNNPLSIITGVLTLLGAILFFVISKKHNSKK
jgi:uncharacterized membrane protein YdjX (TVP38/TMEM64 family)